MKLPKRNNKKMKGGMDEEMQEEFSPRAECVLCSLRPNSSFCAFKCPTNKEHRFCKECTITYVENKLPFYLNIATPPTCPYCNQGIDQSNYYKIIDEYMRSGDGFPQITSLLTTSIPHINLEGIRSMPNKIIYHSIKYGIPKNQIGDVLRRLNRDQLAYILEQDETIERYFGERGRLEREGVIREEREPMVLDEEGRPMMGVLFQDFNGIDRVLMALMAIGGILLATSLADDGRQYFFEVEQLGSFFGEEFNLRGMYFGGSGKNAKTTYIIYLPISASKHNQRVLKKIINDAINNVNPSKLRTRTRTKKTTVGMNTTIKSRTSRKSRTKKTTVGMNKSRTTVPTNVFEIQI